MGTIPTLSTQNFFQEYLLDETKIDIFTLELFVHYQEDEEEDMTVLLSNTKPSRKSVKEKVEPAMSNNEQNEFNQQVNKNKKKVLKSHLFSVKYINWW